ncbi:hypothetical protein ACG2OD_06735 [Streptomyces sp. PDY-4]|uniref:hypothetical protein n=1 Tax=Streptomyces TaxID=1883 RepID=UPI00167C7A7E|nr:hypothetical protein [Streptomyces griseoflavus]
MPEHVLFIVTPVAVGLLIRLIRRPRHMLADLAGIVRDLITLRMILRGTAPDERSALIAAHRAWRHQPTMRRRPGTRPNACGNRQTCDCGCTS